MKKETLTGIGRRVCLGVILLLCLSGCAPKAIITIDEVGSQQIVQSPPGILVLAPEKRLEFFESCLYRVLWYEGRDNYYAFEGIWEPEMVLRDRLVETLRTDFNLTTVPLWEKLEPDAYGGLVKTCEASLNEAREPANPRAVSSQSQGESAFFVEWEQDPPHEYLKAPPPEAISSLKQTLGMEFVLEFSLTGISVVRGCGNSRFEVHAYGRLVRLSDGAVIWLDKARGLYICLQCEYKEFTDLEQDNMKLMKEYYDRAVSDLLDPKKGDLDGGTFFKGLSPG